MKNTLSHINTLLLCLLMTACVDDVTDSEFRNHNSELGPVLFTSGDVGATLTRAVTPYMAQNGRFVCTMYYHPKAGDTDASEFDNSADGTMTTAWLKVNNNLGNSVYRKMSFDETTNFQTDGLGFDKNAPILYWQNRLTHAFLALADYNQLSSNVGAASAFEETTDDSTDDSSDDTPEQVSTQGKLKMFPWGETYDDGTSTLLTDGSVNKYDLTKGTKTKITQQPDPIMALTIMKPAGATQEANRVRLYFKHQFSLIQVNLKGADDASASIKASQIEKVELLGVSTEGYVKNQLNADGTVGTVPANSPAGTMDAAWGNEVHLDKFTDAQLAANKWGTSFEMFDMATGVDKDEDGNDDGYALGFIKSYNAIAFGELWAIRITWREKQKENETEEEITNAIRHVTTFEVPTANDAHVALRELQSGMKYVYDLELRRGTLAIIRTQILKWGQHTDLVYGVEGTITN